MKRLSVSLAASLLALICSAGTRAQSGSVYVGHEQVNMALARGGVLVSDPRVMVAGAHRDKPGDLEPRKGTSILYITEGGGTFSAGGQVQVLTKGDVIVVPAGTRQSFTKVSPSISYYQVTVPVFATGAKADVVYAGHEKVAAALKKAAPLADAPNLRVSGGYRTGPYAPADYRPAVEVHTNEADLFYVIDGSATQVLGGRVTEGKETGPGQIRGSKIEGGQTYHLGKGDVMWVPAGVPHWFPEIPQPLSYLLVKVFY
jgi:quercetin dioxygenase-like cupin family protein